MSTKSNVVPVLLSLAILMAGSYWLGRRSTQLPQPPAASRTAPDGEEVKADRATGEQRLQAGMMVIALRRGLMRGNEGASEPVVIPPEVSRVRFEARVEVNYPRYEAVLQTAENKRIWSQTDPEAQLFSGGKRIVLDVAPQLLPPGDYILSIRGLPTSGSPETVAEYTFHVQESQVSRRGDLVVHSRGTSIGS